MRGVKSELIFVLFEAGDTLIFELELVSPIRRGICHMFGRAFVGNKIVMEGELMAQIAKKN